MSKHFKGVPSRTTLGELTRQGYIYTQTDVEAWSMLAGCGISPNYYAIYPRIVYLPGDAEILTVYGIEESQNLTDDNDCWLLWHNEKKFKPNLLPLHGKYDYEKRWKEMEGIKQ